MRYSHAHGRKADRRPLNKKCIHSFCISLSAVAEIGIKLQASGLGSAESRPHAGGSLLKNYIPAVQTCVSRINKFTFFFSLGRLLSCGVPVTGAHNTSSMCIYVSAEARRINIGHYAASSQKKRCFRCVEREADNGGNV